MLKKIIQIINISIIMFYAASAMEGDKPRGGGPIRHERVRIYNGPYGPPEERLRGIQEDRESARRLLSEEGLFGWMRRLATNEETLFEICQERRHLDEVRKVFFDYEIENGRDIKTAEENAYNVISFHEHGIIPYWEWTKKK